MRFAGFAKSPQIGALWHFWTLTYCCIYRCSCADGNPKRIGNHVFIGTNVVIAKNVTIADGCFISAMSLVNKDVLSENTVMGGYLLAS